MGIGQKTPRFVFMIKRNSVMVIKMRFFLLCLLFNIL